MSWPSAPPACREIVCLSRFTIGCSAMRMRALPPDVGLGFVRPV
jgi:hypothetical protein